MQLVYKTKAASLRIKAALAKKYLTFRLLSHLMCTTISTLRFLALPAAVEFDALGLYSPQPLARILSVGMPRCIRYLTTLKAL